MTNEEIFRKAIKAANQNGYPMLEESLNWKFFRSNPHRQEAIIRGLIFDHVFARALWGNKKIEFSGCEWCGYYDGPYKYICWEYHLQKMVLEKDPLKYIDDFLKKKEG